MAHRLETYGIPRSNSYGLDPLCIRFASKSEHTAAAQSALYAVQCAQGRSFGLKFTQFFKALFVLALIVETTFLVYSISLIVLDNDASRNVRSFGCQ